MSKFMVKSQTVWINSRYEFAPELGQQILNVWSGFVLISISIISNYPQYNWLHFLFVHSTWHVRQNRDSVSLQQGT